MSNLNQLITLGVGNPADITHLVLFGLSEPVIVHSGSISGLLAGPRTVSMRARNPMLEEPYQVVIRSRHPMLAEPRRPQIRRR